IGIGYLLACALIALGGSERVALAPIAKGNQLRGDIGCTLAQQANAIAERTHLAPSLVIMRTDSAVDWNARIRTSSFVTARISKAAATMARSSSSCTRLRSVMPPPFRTLCRSPGCRTANARAGPT